MLKKLVSLLLSLLLCLSLLPGQAGAAGIPEDVPTVQAETSEAPPDDPDELVMPLSEEEFPEEGIVDHSKD